MNGSMQAAYIERFGGSEVVRVGPQPVPRPRAGQVLIEVHAASVNPRDFLLRDGRYVFRHLVVGWPKLLGSDVSGVVVELGARVQGLRVGDRVVAMQTTLGQMGGFAEFMAVDASAVARLPDEVEHRSAAGLPVAGLTALQALRDDVHLRGDERVAVLGASGGVGHYGVQIAKHLGAQVIAVSSAGNHAFVRGLGADVCIDYRDRDPVTELARMGGVDVVFDAIGRSSLAKVRACLRGGGRYVTTVPTAINVRDQLASLPTQVLGVPPLLVSRTVLCRPRGEDLATLVEMLAAGSLTTAIDSAWPLAQITDALARSRSQRARGKIIVTVHGPP